MTATPVSDTSQPRTMIDAAELRSRLSDVRVLDVRTGAEYETAHIPGAYHVPLGNLPEHCDDICGVDGEVVLVCQSGQRAEQAATQLAEAGLSSTLVLNGGMNAWSSIDGDVVRGTQRWSLERQVRLVAGSIALTSVLASTKFPKAKWGAGFIGAGLTFAALSNTCAMGNVLSRLPYNRGPQTDVDAVVDALVSGRTAPDA